MKYARVLLTHCPEETTELFKVYYTGQYRPRTTVEPPPEPQAQPTSTVQSLAGLLPLRYVTGGSGTQAQAPATETAPAEEEQTENLPPQYEVPKPRTAFSAFVDHPQNFISFLETLVQQPELKQEAKVDLFTTLFEMYLDAAKSTKNTVQKQEWEGKAKKLIEGKDVSSSKILWFFPTNITRSQSLHPTSFFSQIYQTSEKVPRLSVNKKACDLTSSAHSHLRRTHRVLFKHSDDMDPMSRSSTLTP
jgi:hypothetical protein